MAGGIPVYCAHDEIRLLAKIIKNGGWRQPITVGTRSGYIVKGHGRLMAAQLGNMEQAPVDYQDYASEAEEYADLIADNRIAELSEIDQKMLADVFVEIDTGEIDLDQTGYTDEEVEKLVTSLSEALHQEIDTEREETAAEEPISQMGDVWMLGKHQVTCGVNDGYIDLIVQRYAKDKKDAEGVKLIRKGKEVPRSEWDVLLDGIE